MDIIHGEVIIILFNHLSNNQMCFLVLSLGHVICFTPSPSCLCLFWVFCL
jgi:hypothetical protein